MWVVPTLSVSTLTGRHVILEPLGPHHVDAIAAAAAGDRSTFGLTHVPDGIAEAERYVSALAGERERGLAAPFAQVRVGDGVVVGCTRFMNPSWPLRRADPDEVEIGGTWLSPAAQRTPINTDAKRLLLTHAFETWQVQRVAICTDARNARSRTAIERLGATFEGILRRHRLSAMAADGSRLRDSASYSVTIDDWPAVRARLDAPPA